MTNKIYYFILPKNIKGLLYKSYPYVAAVVITFLATDTINIPVVLSMFLLMELLISPARYILNDIHDYQGDVQRGSRWTKPIHKSDFFVFKLGAWARIVLGTLIVWLVNPMATIFPLALIIQQLFYDNILKRRFPMLSTFSISTGYVIRFLYACYFIGSPINIGVIAVGLCILIFAMFSAVQWRITESEYINHNKITVKPGGSFFSSTTATKSLDIMFSLLLLSTALLASGIFVSHIRPEASLCIFIICTLLVLIILMFNTNLILSVFPIAFFCLMASADYKFSLASVPVTIFVIYFYNVRIQQIKRGYFSNK